MRRYRHTGRRRRLEDSFTVDFESFDELRNRTLSAKTPASRETNDDNSKEVGSQGRLDASTWSSCGDGFTSQRNPSDAPRGKIRPVDLVKVRDKVSGDRRSDRGCRQRKTSRPLPQQPFTSDLEASPKKPTGEDSIAWSDSDSQSGDGQRLADTSTRAKAGKSGTLLEESDDDVTIAASDSDSCHSPVQVLTNPGDPEKHHCARDAVQGTKSWPPSVPEIHDSEEEDGEATSWNGGQSSSSVQVTSPSIGSLSSVSVSPLGSPGRSGVKASAWMTSLHWQKTPKKEELEDVPSAAEVDSAKKKKKKKYSSGTFAEQVWRLMCREKSSVRMRKWNKAEGEGSSKHCTLQVLELAATCGLTLARCQVLSASPSSQESGLELADSATTRKIQSVLFHQQLAESLCLSKGCLVQLLPPWQELDGAAGGQSVILCSQHARVLPQAELSPLAVGGEAGWRGDVLQWKCPCSLDPQIPPTDCPAQKFPFSPSAVLNQIGPSDTAAHGSTDSALHTVATSKRAPLPTEAVSDSILESLERSGANSQPLAFTALVQRAFSRVVPGTPNSECQWTHLVEDRHGAVAVLALPDCQAQGVCEGMVYSFHGLSVLLRQNRDRDPTLFSVIDQLWSERTVEQAETGLTSHSQDSLAASDQSKAGLPASGRPPGFCYVLGVRETDTLQARAVEEPSPVPVYRPASVSTLTSQSLPSLVHTRVTFLARLLHVVFSQEDAASRPGSASPSACPATSPAPELSSQQAWLFLAGDSGTETSGGTTDLDPEPCVRVKVTRGCEDCLHALKGPVVKVTEAYCLEGGCLLLDRFSRVEGGITETSPSVAGHGQKVRSLSRLSVRLPPLSDNMAFPTLAAVSGVITGVDEASAFTWEECEHCGSDKIAARPDRQLVCLACHQAVVSPRNRVKMVAIVRADLPCSTLTVKLDLLEETITNLLPEDGSEEGYDVGCVLGRRLEALSCVLLKKEGRWILAEEILLEPVC